MDSESVGEQFRKAREARGASLSEAAAATRIKFQHIEAMERDDFSKIAAAAYAKGFIKIYAEFLHLPPAPLIEQYNERHLSPGPQARPKSLPARRTRERRRAAEKSDTPAPPRTVRYLVTRVALPVCAIVAGILILSALTRAAAVPGNKDASTGSPSLPGPASGWLLEEPPDAYLSLEPEDGPRP